MAGIALTALELIGFITGVSMFASLPSIVCILLCGRFRNAPFEASIECIKCLYGKYYIQFDAVLTLPVLRHIFIFILLITCHFFQL